jgi:hypothetical protein
VQRVGPQSKEPGGRLAVRDGLVHGDNALFELAPRKIIGLPGIVGMEKETSKGPFTPTRWRF